jgi:hypothetical protein
MALPQRAAGPVVIIVAGLVLILSKPIVLTFMPTADLGWRRGPGTH